ECAAEHGRLWHGYLRAARFPADRPRAHGDRAGPRHGPGRDLLALARLCLTPRDDEPKVDRASPELSAIALRGAPDRGYSAHDRLEPPQAPLPGRVPRRADDLRRARRPRPRRTEALRRLHDRRRLERPRDPRELLRAV